MKRKILTVVLAVLLILAAIPGQAFAADTSAIHSRVIPNMYAKLSADPTYDNDFSWYAIDIAASGDYRTDDLTLRRFYESYIAELQKRKGQPNAKVRSDGSISLVAAEYYTANAKTVLLCNALGGDAADIGGYDILGNLCNLENGQAGLINGPMWALIALNSNEYEIPEEVIDFYLDWILNGGYMDSKGGWKLQKEAANIDVDTTGMMLYALAPYMNENYPEVQAAADKAIAKLSEIQNEDGSFSAIPGKTASCETTAWVMTGLCAAGINPETDGRFVKKQSALVGLMQYMDGDGFKHILTGSVSYGYSTYEAVYALLEYERMMDGKNHVFDFREVKPPVIPAPEKTGLSLSAAKDGTVKASWKKVEAADGYQLRYSRSESFASYTGVSVSGLSKTAADVEPCIPYYYMVRAWRWVNGQKLYGEWSEVKSVAAKLAIPEGLKVTAGTENACKAVWKKTPYAYGYELSYKVDGGTYKAVTVTGTSKTVSSLKRGKKYTVKVRAFRTVNGVKKYSSSSAEKSVYIAPAKPASLTAKSAKKKQLKVSWKKAEGASGYQVGYKKGSGSFKYVTTTSLSKTLKPLKSGKKYTVKVRAYVKAGTSKKSGAWSSAKTVTVK